MGFPGISRRMHGGNCLKFCMLVYLDHLQNWLVYGHSLLIFLIWHYFDLVKRAKFGVSGHFPENAWMKRAYILHADVSWPPAELISLCTRSVDFCNFGTILTLWNGSKLGFPGISRRNMEEMAWNFARWCILNTYRTDSFLDTVCWFY